MVGDYRGSFTHPSSEDSEDTTSSLYSVGKECIGREWTDEKHCLYLKSMEASFVDQLYNLIGSNPNKENIPEIGSSRKFGSKPSDEQFKVLRDGFWQKMNLKQPEYQHEYLRSPWIKRYKPLREGSSHLRHRDHIGIQQEVSDQNFVNEIAKGENGSSKKMKTVTSTDQVVPIRKTPET